MAFQQDFTTADGIEVVGAYWRIVQLNISVADTSATFTLYAYKDQAARNAKKYPLAGGVKMYSLSSEEFLAMYQQHIAPGGPNLLVQCYTYARNKKDVKLEDGSFVSFFENAIDI